MKQKEKAVEPERIRARIEQIREQKRQFVENINRQIGAFDGAIAALEQLLEGVGDEGEG